MNKKIKLALRLLIYVLSIHVVVSLIVVYQLINPQGIRTMETPGDFNLNYEVVDFKSQDGVNLKGWYIDSFTSDASTVILMHGFPADKGDMLPEAGYLARNFNVFMFDYRSLGESEGKFSTLGGKETNDLHGAIDYLKNEKEVEEVFLWGFSMGAGVALQVAPERDEISAIVSDSSFSSMDKGIEEIIKMPGLSKSIKPFFRFWAYILTGIDTKEVSPEKAARKIDVPVYIIHAMDDSVVSIFHGKALKEAMSENEELKVEFTDSDRHGALNESLMERLKNFLLENKN